MDPCGYAMDALRSCYDVQMRFPGFGVFWVRWYFTNKPCLDFNTVYNSHNHVRDEGDEDGDTGEPGEVWGSARPYYRGDPPPPSCCTGPRGSAAAWLGIFSPSDPRYNVPSCPGARGAGGIRLGGQAYSGRRVFGGLVLGGQSYQLAQGSGGLRLDGQATVGQTGSGGLALGGDSRRLAVGSGGLVLDGVAQLGQTGSGGLLAGGQSIRLAQGGGGVLLSGSADVGQAVSGGLLLDGAGLRLAQGSGGLLLDGTGLEGLTGAGGLLLDGNLGQLQQGSGGLLVDGQSIQLQQGSGGLVLDGLTTGYAVTTFVCGSQVATGTTQGTAALIANDTVAATSTGVNQGLILPAGCYRVAVRNMNTLGGNTIMVYPPSGAKFQSTLVNVGQPIAAQSGYLFIEISATQWMFIPLS